MTTVETITLHGLELQSDVPVNDRYFADVDDDRAPYSAELHELALVANDIRDLHIATLIRETRQARLSMTPGALQQQAREVVQPLPRIK